MTKIPLRFSPPFSPCLSLLTALLLLSTCWSCAPLEQQHQYLAPNATETRTTAEEETSTKIDFQLVETLKMQQSLPSETSEIEELVPPEPDTTIAAEARDLDLLGHWQEKSVSTAGEEEEEPENNFPITINRQVEYYLNLFQNRSRKSFSRWLTRSGRYVPMISQKLKEAGLPTDLAYLPMIESGYALNAYSKAKAVGPWQFMRATAIHFGLTINNYVDERRDPIKSTQAAIAYLTTLHEEFDSWELAVAGYNAGEGRIRRAIKKYKTNDFWEIAEKRHLASETKLYVPKLIAAILIAKSPEKYGFSEIDYAEPMDFEYAEVPRWTSLQAVATALNTDSEELLELNRELRKKITPPDQRFYNLKVPKGSGPILAQNLARVHTTVTTQIKYHKIQNKDTLNKICQIYNINKTTLLKANNLHKAKLIPGKMLRIPYQVTKYALLSKEEMEKGTLASQNGDFILHKIRPGESVGQISRRYNVSPNLIAAWNDLANINKIRAGQQLALYVNSPSQPVTTKNLKNTEHVANTDKKVPTIRGSQKIAVPHTTTSEASENTYYEVKGGDSLWQIARRFNLNTDDLKRWNNLKNNTIKPGLKLLVKLEEDSLVTYNN